MKKLFTLLAAMGIASASMAQAVSTQDVRKVDTYNSVAGAWNFTLQYVDGSTAKAGYPTYYASLQDRNVVQFDDDTKNFWSFNGIYSPSTKKITFTREYIGDASGLYVYQEPVVISDKGELEYKSYSAQVSDDFFNISFEQDCGMIWAAYKDEQGTQLAEIYAIYDFIKAERPLNEKNWKDVGMAKFMDGWVLPALGINQYENEYEVFKKNVFDVNNEYDDIRDNKKLHFHMNSGTIKISTVHSFKGWESEVVFLLIENKGAETSFDELLYTGLTRTRTNLIVINLGNSAYHENMKKLIEPYK